MTPITYNNTDFLIEEGAAFIFGPWICTADGMGGFSSYFANSVISLPHPASSPDALGDLAGKLGNLEIADPIPTQARNPESDPVSGPSETHLPGVSFGLRNSTRTLPAKNNSGSTRNHLDSKVVLDDDDNVTVQQGPRDS
jgi:hypothetical protein